MMEMWANVPGVRITAKPNRAYDSEICVSEILAGDFSPTDWRSGVYKAPCAWVGCNQVSTDLTFVRFTNGEEYGICTCEEHGKDPGYTWMLVKANEQQ